MHGEVGDRFKNSSRNAKLPFTRRWWSGLTHETVNLAPSGFVGSNPTRRTETKTSRASGDFCLCAGASELLRSRVGFERSSM